MSPKDFKIAVTKVAPYLRNDFPRSVGVEGEQHFKESFHNEGFTDTTLQKWQEVKRRTEIEQKLVLKQGKTRRSQKYTKAERTRQILTGESGELGESIRWEADYNKVAFQTDVPYAQAHNEGTTNAGRNHKVTIPKRQFMGPSQQLSDRLKKELEQYLNAIFRK